MHAIQTKVIDPTNRRGCRIRAKCERGSLVIAYDHGMTPEENHRKAAGMLLDKFAKQDAQKYGESELDHHWGKFVSGSMHDGSMAHVLIRRWRSVWRGWSRETRAGRA